MYMHVYIHQCTCINNIRVYVFECFCVSEGVCICVNANYLSMYLSIHLSISLYLSIHANE